MIRLFRPAEAPVWLEAVLVSIERMLRLDFGFQLGDGGEVTQATSKATAVRLDARCGNITTTNASLAAGTIVSFTLNNVRIAADDQILVTHHSGGTKGAYTVNGAATGTGTATINIRNNTAGALAEALVLKVSVIRSFRA